MNTYYITDHMNGCDKERGVGYFLFQMMFDFNLIAYCPCYMALDHLETKEDILRQISEDNIRSTTSAAAYNSAITRGVLLSNAVRDNKYDALLGRRHKLREVSYIYHSATQCYCFEHTMPGQSYAKLILDYKRNYNTAISEIKELDEWERIKENLLKQAESLYIHNKNPVESLSDKQVWTLNEVIKHCRVRKFHQGYRGITKAVDFYASAEWRELRKAVIKKYGTACMKCGYDSKYCHVDHIKPRSKYPMLEMEFDNLQILCRRCNYMKSNRDETDYRENIKCHEYSTWN